MIIAILLIFLVFVMGFLLMTRRTSTRPFVDKGGHIIKGSIAEQLYLPIGGIQQWVLLRGKNTRNPILIFLHGGPGTSEHAPFLYYQRPLEDYFIVVGWDQRCAGKTYRKNPVPQNLTINDFVSDLHELVEYLKKRFHQEKIYIVGKSWGSLVGTLYAQQHPENVAAYIGVGQISNLDQSLEQTYKFILEQANLQKNTKAIKALQKISLPPGKNRKDVHVLSAWMVRFGGHIYGKTSLFPLILTFLRIDEYAWPDLILLFQGSKVSERLLWSQLYQANLFQSVPRIDAPVYFFLGRHDQCVSSLLAEKYFEQLQAPVKKLVWFEKSGHNPLFEEPALFCDALLAIL